MAVKKNEEEDGTGKDLIEYLVKPPLFSDEEANIQGGFMVC